MWTGFESNGTQRLFSEHYSATLTGVFLDFTQL